MTQAPDDPYEDIPLWDDHEPGICIQCGNITEDPGEKLCDSCAEEWT